MDNFFSYKFSTFILQDNQVICLNKYFPYYRNQTGNMGPYYPFEVAPFIHTRAKRIMLTAPCAFFFAEDF